MSALSAVLLIFSFQLSLLFFHIGRQAAQRCTCHYLVYPISDIGRCRNLGSTLLIRGVDSNGKMVMRPEVARRWNLSMNFCVFRKNDPLRYNFQNSVPKVFTASPIDVVVFKFREIWPTGNRRNRALFAGQKTLNFGCLAVKLCYCTDRAQNLPGPTPNNVLSALTF